MGYIGSLREVLQLLFQAFQNGQDTRNFLPQIREIIENRERDIRRHLQRDPGHDHAARYWLVFKVTLLLIANVAVAVIAAAVGGGALAPEIAAVLH